MRTQDFGGLKRQTAIGLFWSLGQAWGVRLITLLHYLVIARFLEPSDLGLVAFAITIVACLGSLADLGITTWIESTPPQGADTLDSAWWSTVIVSALMAGALVAVAPALAWVPFVADFNRELLTVTGLKPGSYALRIDGTPVRTVTAAELAAGLNLALEPSTPQARQALEVAAKLEAYRALVTAELRGIAQFEHQVMGKVPHPITVEQAQPYVAARLEAFRKNPPPARSTAQNAEFYLERKAREAASRAEAARLAAEARRMAQPVPHTYELVPVAAPAT